MIYFGERIRVSGEGSSWVLETRKENPDPKAKNGGWGGPKYYSTLRGLTDAITMECAKSASEYEEAITVRSFIDKWKSNMLGTMGYVLTLAELAQPELQGRWQALGIEGVPSQISELTDEQLTMVETTYADDAEVLAVVDLLENCRGMQKLLVGLK